MSGLELFAKGGFLIWPILLCSVIGMAVFFERLFSLRAAQDREGVTVKILQLLERGRFPEAKEILASRRRHRKRKGSSAEFVLQEAIAVQGSEQEVLEIVLAHTVERELDYLGRHMGILATAGNISPLLGLLGTVVGMIKAFIVVENMGGRVNATVLAGGIWEAMLTTALGLLVAIPLIIVHSYLEGRLNMIRAHLEDITVSLIKIWKEPVEEA
jgi:biopolymer transport protein ExbB